MARTAISPSDRAHAMEREGGSSRGGDGGEVEARYTTKDKTEIALWPAARLDAFYRPPDRPTDDARASNLSLSRGRMRSRGQQSEAMID